MTPPGINRFDLHPYHFLNGKPADYRSDRKGHFRQPRPVGSRMGPQNMITCGIALQALRTYPGLWDQRRKDHAPDDLLVPIVDPVPHAGSEQVEQPNAWSQKIDLGGAGLSLCSARDALRISCMPRRNQPVSFKVFARVDAKGSWADVSIANDFHCIDCQRQGRR